MLMRTASVILAAGLGKRMNSALPKVLHPLAGKAMITYSIQAAAAVSDLPPVVVIGHGGELVQQFVGDSGRCVVQQPQLGTAHALMSAQAVLQGQAELVVVTTADMPLLTAETVRRLVEAQRAYPGPFTMLTIINADARGFGRVLRGQDGSVQAIVEEAQATPEQLKIHELNASIYCFRADWLWPALQRIPLSPKGEYYLTDTVALAVQEGLAVQAVLIEDPAEAMGVNNRVHLAEAESILRWRISQQMMLAGVTLVDPATTYIQPGVKIGRDTVIYPNTHLRGETVIGQECRIGPNTIIEDTRIGDRCMVLSSVLEGALLEDEVSMGPFGHLRTGAHLGRGVHMGNFGEVKSSYLGPGTKMGHFSYIGDAQIGEDVNIGAGTITCNFDGEHKHKTHIGDHVFIGSDTMLVAPVEIGDGARTGAGSVVTHDVEAGGLVAGVPARPMRKKAEND
jgi:bifunctional UDP-N-acetylglucosamine pyrophosphorylase/glucosamine-1-phosphate N-acetyltransferase